jgi:hypothetical protein
MSIQNEIINKIKEGNYGRVDSNKDSKGNYTDTTLADLRSTNLRNQTISGLNLEGANLDNAHLDRANLTGAKMEGATFNNAELYGAIVKQKDIPFLESFGIKRAILNDFENFSKQNPSFVSERPELKRRMSINISNQGNTRLCWAYTMSKVIHKFLKSILVELKTTETDDEICDVFYSDTLFKKNIDVINPVYCGGDKEYKNLILFMFIFTELTTMNPYCFGSSSDDTFIYMKNFVDTFINKSEDVSHCFNPMSKIGVNNCRVVINLLQKVRDTCNDCASCYSYGLGSDNFTYDNFFDKVKSVIDKELYLYINLDINKSTNPIFEKFKSQHASHAMTIVGYNDDINGKSIIIKNSWGKNWGDQGFVTILLSELEEHEQLDIIWAEQKNKEGGQKSRKNRKSKKSRKSRKSRKNKKNRKSKKIRNKR